MNYKVLLGSTNPVKIAAVDYAFKAVFTDCEIVCQGVSAPSGVADQPMDTEQTKAGALNRVEFCAKEHGGYDFYVAIEGGVDLFAGSAAAFACIAIKHEEQLIVGRSANLPLPVAIYRALEQGEELGDVMDRLFNTHNIKQKGGAIGLLTNELETRQSTYQQALVLALAPFIHPQLYLPTNV